MRTQHSPRSTGATLTRGAVATVAVVLLSLLASATFVSASAQERGVTLERRTIEQAQLELGEKQASLNTATKQKAAADVSLADARVVLQKTQSDLDASDASAFESGAVVTEADRALGDAAVRKVAAGDALAVAEATALDATSKLAVAQTSREAVQSQLAVAEDAANAATDARSALGAVEREIAVATSTRDKAMGSLDKATLAVADAQLAYDAAVAAAPSSKAIEVARLNLDRANLALADATAAYEAAVRDGAENVGKLEAAVADASKVQAEADRAFGALKTAADAVPAAETTLLEAQVVEQDAKVAVDGAAATIAELGAVAKDLTAKIAAGEAAERDVLALTADLTLAERVEADALAVKTVADSAVAEKALAVTAVDAEIAEQTKVREVAATAQTKALAASKTLTASVKTQSEAVAQLEADVAQLDQQVKSLQAEVLALETELEELGAVITTSKTVAVKVGAVMPALERIAPERALTAVSLTSGAVPAGVVFDTKAMTFEGRPAKVGEAVATFTLEDGVDTEVRTITWMITEADPVLTSAVRHVTACDELAPLAPINDGNAVEVQAVEGDIPAGAALEADGTFSGLPNVAGSYTAAVTLRDTVTGEREIRTVRIEVAEKDPVATAVVRMVTRGEELAPLAPVNDGNEFTAELVDGDLPAGVKLATDGTLSGAATTVGVTNAQIMLRDTVTFDRELRAITFEVTERPVIETVGERALVRGDAVKALAPVYEGMEFSAELVEGVLPAGVKLATDGTFSGEAGESGVFEAQILKTDTATGDRELLALTMTVSDKEAVETLVSKSIKRGVTPKALAPVNGDNPVTAELVDGELPSGVKLVEGGSFTGAPDKLGEFVSRVLVSDTVTGDRELRTITWAVEVGDATPTTKSLSAVIAKEMAPVERINVKYPIRVALIDGAMPDGVTVAEDGTLVGAPTKAGTFTATVQVTDTVTGEREDRTLTIEVAEKDPVATAAVRMVTRGEELAPLAPVNDGNEFTAELVDGDLPAGVKLVTDGTLSGAATTVGVTNAQVMLRDTVTGDRELRAITFEVTERPVVETSKSLAATQGRTLEPVFAAGSDLTAELVEGSLPDGVTLNEDGSFDGVPKTIGEFAMQILVTDTVTNDRELVSIAVEVSAQTPTYETRSRSIEVARSIAPVERINAPNPISAELMDGELPTGVALAEDGSFMGRPTAPGTWAPKVLVVDQVTFEREVRTMSLTVAPATPVEVTEMRTMLLGEEAGDLTPINTGHGITAETISGELPDGVELTSDGRLEGSPTTPGTTMVQVMVTDSLTGEREDRTIVFNVSERPAVESQRTTSAQVGIEPEGLASINAGNPMTTSLVSGVLPTGVTMNGDGSFEGAPTQAGTYTFAVLATDSLTFERELVAVTMTVAPATPTNTEASGTGEVGQALDPIAPINEGNDVAAELVSGELPDGVSLNDDGSFTGAPTAPGDYEFAVLVTDTETGEAELRSMNLSVAATPAETSELIVGSVGRALDPLEPVNPGNSMTASIVSGELPAGVTMSSTGSLLGTPTQVGVSEAKVMLTDNVTGERELRTVKFSIGVRETTTFISRTVDTIDLGSNGSASAGATNRTTSNSTSGFGAAPEQLAFVDDGDATLAFTGANSTSLALFGSSLVIAGAAAVALSKRRRDDD